MEKKKSNKISWSTIYSLGLVPAILVWGLAPSLKENVIVLTSIIAGIIWTIFSRLYIHFLRMWNNRVDNRVVYDIWRNNKSILAPFRVL